MTCIVVDKKNRIIATDSANTDSSGLQWRTSKIEYLKDGRIFLGSGHNLTIRLAKQWAEDKFKGSIPQHMFELITSNADSEDYAFSCLVVDPKTNNVQLLDEEMVPLEPHGDHFAVGSGGAYALGALYAGATAEQAVEAACTWDQACTGPIVAIAY